MSVRYSEILPDVLVVGAGIIGAACARELVREGLRVEVVDAGPPGGGTTSDGMGHLVLTEASEAQFALGRLSLELWQEARAELPAGSDYLQTGTLWLAEDDRDLAAAHARERFLSARGIACELLDEAGLRAAEPRLRPGLAGGLRVPGDGGVCPPAVATGWLETAQETGRLRLRIGVEVTQITGGETPAALTASGERLAAGRVIDAAGYRALELLPVPVVPVIRPRKGHLLVTERSPGFCRHQLVELGYLQGAHSASAETIAFNLHPRPDGQLVVGASRQLGVTDRQVEPSIVEGLLARATSFVPALSELAVLGVRTGFRPATEDHLPLLGAVPGLPGVLLAAGHEGLGITLCLGSARLLADEILGRPSVIPREPYRPNRTAENHDFPTAETSR